MPDSKRHLVYAAAYGNVTQDAATVTKRFVEAAVDEIADELREALKG